MTERELRRLSRSDLLELLLAQRKENEQLRCILDETQAKLADRTFKIDNAGSIADAAMQISGIFAAAQDSCQSYIDNIKQLSERQTQICQKMEQETKEKCDRMIAEAEQKSREYWERYSEKIKELVDSFEGLNQVLDVYSAHRRKTGGSAY
ncbi:MAG: hypothetical protein II230_08935 [Clostridia bacterium]|nr:hypothetical protein [Clostridia bacterium]